RQPLQPANRLSKHVDFIDRGIVSVLARPSEDPLNAEVGLIGPEGMTGLAVLPGSARSPNETGVQMEGSAQRIHVEDLKDAMPKSGTMTECLLRYAHCFGVQVAHSARANALGYIEARVARWLLMARDRLEDNDLPLTHDFLATVLGVRRAGVTGVLN